MYRRTLVADIALLIFFALGCAGMGFMFYKGAGIGIIIFLILSIITFIIQLIITIYDIVDYRRYKEIEKLEKEIADLIRHAIEAEEDF